MIRINNTKKLNDILKVFAVLYKSCRKSDLSVLHHISLSVGNRTQLRMTDLEIFLSVFLETEEAKPGFEAILPFKAFKDYVARKRGKITISEIPEGIRIDDALLSDLPSPEDYPSFLEIPSEMPYSVGDKEFADALSFSLPFICKEDARFVLCGVCLEFPCKGESPFKSYEQAVRLVATDGHRLSISEIPLEGPETNKLAVIVPKLAVEILAKLAKVSSSSISFVVEDNFVHFRGENWTLSVKPIDGVYPDYRAVIPQKGIRYVFDAEKMYEVLKDVESIISFQQNPYSGMKYKPIYLQLGRNKIEIFVNNGESAAYTKKSIPVAPSDKPFTLPVFAFNISYLLEALRGRAGKVVLTCLDQSRPAVFQFGNDPQKLALIMPMTRDEEGPHHEVPHDEVLQPLPDVMEMERYREVRKSGGRKKLTRSKKTECATCKKLQKENELLREQIEFLEAQLQKTHFELKGEETHAEAHATEAELLRERIAELEALLKALTRQEQVFTVPVQVRPEGDAVAALDGTVYVFKGGVVLRPNGNGGEPVGRYDRKTGLGQIGGRTIRLRKDGGRWVLEVR